MRTPSFGCSLPKVLLEFRVVPTQLTRFGGNASGLIERSLLFERHFHAPSDGSDSTPVLCFDMNVEVFFDGDTLQVFNAIIAVITIDVMDFIATTFIVSRDFSMNCFPGFTVRFAFHQSMYNGGVQVNVRSCKRQFFRSMVGRAPASRRQQLSCTMP